MTKLHIEIRAYRPDDNQRLCEIWHAASRISHSFLPADLLEDQKALISSTFLPETEIWVACHDGVPVGFIGLIDQFIGGLFVAPSRTGHGIGSKLLEHASDLKGQMLLEVYAANTQACAFYRRHGFSGIKRRETDDNGLPFPLILMQRPYRRRIAVSLNSQPGENADQMNAARTSTIIR